MSSVAGADWAKRKPPQNLLVKATAAEDAVADELEQVWLHPTGSSPYSGAASALFPWTIAKAFFCPPRLPCVKLLASAVDASPHTRRHRISRSKLKRWID
ncbi:hypothetical protein JCM18916_741 [Cutibacterium acnes JCM 18916]|nr:hypothetical protein JCM18916_741 [Cutibacterium acnes JCM 18916]